MQPNFFYQQSFFQVTSSATSALAMVLTTTVLAVFVRVPPHWTWKFHHTSSLATIWSLSVTTKSHKIPDTEPRSLNFDQPLFISVTLVYNKQELITNSFRYFVSISATCSIVQVHSGISYVIGSYKSSMFSKTSSDSVLQTYLHESENKSSKVISSEN